MPKKFDPFDWKPGDPSKKESGDDRLERMEGMIVKLTEYVLELRQLLVEHLKRNKE